MTDKAPALAYVSILLLGAAMGGVIYLGTREGPSTPPGTGPAGATGATAGTPGAPTGSPSSGAGASLTFVASADLTPHEQAILERVNEARANPAVLVPTWQKQLADERAAKRVPCDEPDSMLESLRAYKPMQPLAANQQLTDAARAHAKDEVARKFWGHVNPDGVGSNQRIVAAGYPLPIGKGIGGFTYSDKKDAVNTESIFMTQGRDEIPASAWPDAVDSLIIDACVPSRGHRDHVLGVSGTSPLEPEIGVGTASGPRQHHVVLETATRLDGNFYVLGVVYRDADKNGRYDAGEGVANVQIDARAAGVTTKSGPGGGFALPVKDGTTGELATGGGAVKPFAVKGANVKVDFVVP
ncbi:MAG: CAP domain-containing protein [Myxococcales bacterium]|nr:CAP domain-containing protein [Myxococcales bacterium]